MRYIIFLMLLLSIGAQPAAARADDTRYRVEILVLTHLEGNQEPQQVQAVEDFSYALDFLTPPQESEEEGEPAAVPAQEEVEFPAATGDEPLNALETPAEETAEDPWNVVTHVEAMGPQMQEAWRRLRLSGPFRPLQFLAWDQGSSEPFPVLRVHDLEAIRVEDPWAEQRLAAQQGDGTDLAGEDGSVVFSDPQAPPDEEETDDPTAPPLPDPIVYYRLDGTASLSRSRFLHLSLAIELREPVYTEEQLSLTSAAPPALPAEPQPLPEPSSYLVHRLEQKRSVRTGRMEYFDGPVLGVLAWITDISDTVTDAQLD